MSWPISLIQLFASKVPENADVVAMPTISSAYCWRPCCLTKSSEARIADKHPHPVALWARGARAASAGYQVAPSDLSFARSGAASRPRLSALLRRRASVRQRRPGEERSVDAAARDHRAAHLHRWHAAGRGADEQLRDVVGLQVA